LLRELARLTKSTYVNGTSHTFTSQIELTDNFPPYAQEYFLSSGFIRCQRIYAAQNEISHLKQTASQHVPEVRTRFYIPAKTCVE
jgi:hypothetical protein